jgi:hypothetical protein
MSHHFRSSALAALMFVCLSNISSAQDLTSLAHRPRFIAAWSPPGVVIDASRMPVLSRRVSLELDRVSLDEALRAIGQQAHINLTYRTGLLPAGKIVSLRVREITTAAALTEVLYDTDLDVAVSQTGQLALITRSATEAMRQVASIHGTVTDAKTHEPIQGAQVSVDGLKVGATTGENGTYRISGIPPGTFTMNARRLGYGKSTQTVTVSDGADAVIDFTLEKAATTLDQVVTTGTVIPTEVKAVPRSSGSIRGALRSCCRWPYRAL